MKSFFFKPLIMASLVVLMGNGLYAQIPNGYYNNATGKTGDELKAALHDIIDGHTTISYQQIWNAFWSTDNKGNNVVWDMYSDGANYTYNYYNGTNSQQCGEYEQEGDCYNREHSWPQSWFSGGEQSNPGRDLHHIFPTDGYVNYRRSSFPYGEVSNATWTSQNGSKLGSCKSSLGYTGTVFEPIDEYKGDFARAMMYMSVRYYGEDSEWGLSDMTNKSEILPWAMTMLLNWNDNDPVSQKEIDRNNAVYNIQGNRNPFIDHPEYARMIWDPNWHGGIGGYVKVTSSDEITDGDYLIVCENNGVAFNGALTILDATNNTIEVSIFENNIESNATTDASAFTIAAKTGGGYSIKSASGYYIGNSSDANALKTSQTDVYVNTITILEDGNADIISSSSHLRYNANVNDKRFRYYKSSTYTNQQAIQLYKKIMVYNINLASVEHGSISADAEEAVEGATVTLTATPEAGYELDHWTVTDTQNNAIEVMNNQFVMPASDVTVSATFVYVGTFAQQYHLVTNVNQLVAGRTYLIVNTNARKAMGASSSNGNNRTAVDVTITDNVIPSLGNACELTLGSEGNYWTFFDANWNTSGGYLYAASSSANQLKTQATNNENGKWSISITSNGVATIQAQGTNTRNVIKYNSGNNPPIFSCYASSNTNMQNVYLFIRSEEYDHTESETIANLFPFDKHTVRSGATLTVSGTATCTDASHLVLEDGAQLVHHSDNVMATVKKSIQGYTNNGGWYTIAVPFTSYTPAGNIISDTFDLYSYVENAELEWNNYKAHQNDFVIATGMGYLYAHNPSTILRMTGTLNNGNYSKTVNLSYANNDENLRGFNLLGNPTAHDISFTKTSGVSDGYYYLDNAMTWMYSTTTTVPAGRGLLVKANNGEQSVTLNPQSKGDTAEKGQYLCFSVGNEKAYIKLNDGVSMPLAELNGHHSSLYLARDRQPYAMLVRDGAATLDLCLEPRCRGEQTLMVDTQGLVLDYLHLIDHITGADVDLLATPEYTFDVKPDDYIARFQIVFSASINVEDNTPFAYFADGQIIVTYEGEATLQVIDMLGRMVDKNNLAPGIYVLRLITDDAVRVQKIKVR